MGFRVACRRRQVVHNSFQHSRHAQACLRADGKRVGGIQSNRLLNHFLAAFHVSARQIDLVDDGNNIQAVIDRDISVRQRLRFHSWVASTISRAPSQEASERETS